MTSFREKYGAWAVVTGASSGIGVEYARQLADKGLDVVLVARRADRLQKLADELGEDYGVRTKVIAADLSEPSGIEAVVRNTMELDIGLLVNNAGREDSGRFLDIPAEEALATLRLNCEAPLQLTHHFAQRMQARGRGGILFMSSIVAFQGVPFIANYAATKAYDLILAESLAAELGPHGIDVAVLAPGFTDSELSPQANFDGLPIRPMSAAAAARAGIKSLRRSRLSVPGFINKFLYASGKYLQPRAMSTWSFGRVFQSVLRFKLKGEAAVKTASSTRNPEHRHSWDRPEGAQSKGGVLRRSTILAVIIGSALTLINQFDALFGSDTIQIVPLLLGFVTPFVVVAISQLAAVRQARLDATREQMPGTTEHPIATAFLHGIPARAVTIGLIVGTVNSAIVLSQALLSTGDFRTAPATLIAQVYVLPVLFGFLSQAVSYRRAARIYAA